MSSNPYILTQYLGLFAFYIEILIMQLLFMRTFKRRKYFPLRIAGVSGAAVGFAFIPMLMAGMINFSFILIALYAVFGIWFLFKTDFLNCVFYTVTAWTVQHIASQCVWILCCYAKMSLAVNIIAYLAIYCGCYALIYFICSYKRRVYEINGDKLTVIVISALAIVLMCTLHDLVGYFSEWEVWYSMFAIMGGLLILFVQFGLTDKQNLKNERIELEHENEILEGLLYRQSKQQKLTNETIEIINRKCHDLKHQIAALRTMASEDSEKYLKQIERAVMVYGDIAKTGNNALDITLTEKCLLCDEHKIKFTYMVDVESLAIMQPTDVSTLFGNILDNAIECADSEDEEKRIIRMNVCENRGYLKIHCENFCSRNVEFESDLPKTNKTDRAYHGFGVKSIRYIAQKYGGTLYMGQQDELFNVNVIVPLSK